jgi:hypothetical protein
MVMLRAFLFIAVLGFTAGCGDDIVPTTPTPDRPQVTETFSGTLTVNGGASHSFTSGSGLITVTLNTLSPDSAATIGVSLGTWNTNSSCQVVIAKDSATQADSVVGNASTTGSFCARVYDVGRLGAATEYTLTVVHF